MRFGSVFPLCLIGAISGASAERHVYLDTNGNGQLNDCPNPAHNAKGLAGNTDELFYCVGGSQAGKIIGLVTGTTTAVSCIAGGGAETAGCSLPVRVKRRAAGRHGLAQRLEVSDEIVDLLRVVDAGGHDGSRHRLRRCSEECAKSRFIPPEAGFSHDAGMHSAFSRSRLAADNPVEHRPNRDLGTGTDLVAGAAHQEILLTCRGILCPSKACPHNKQRCRNDCRPEQ
jgi:hypothetical protein